MYLIVRNKKTGVIFCTTSTAGGFKILWSSRGRIYAKLVKGPAVSLSLLMGATEVVYRSKSKAKALRYAQMHSLLGV